MEGQDIKGLMEAYSHIYSEPEALNEEVETEEVNMEVEEDSEVLDEQGRTRNRTSPEQVAANRRALRNRLLYGNPEGRRPRTGGGQGNRGSRTRNRRSSSTPTPPPFKGPGGDPSGSGRGQAQQRPPTPTPPSAAPASRPSSAPAAKTPTKPTGAADPRNAGYVKDRAAISTAKTPEAKAAATKKAEKTGMDAWAKANPKLAAAKAERDRTRGTSSTTNPLMQDMKSRMPAAAPKKTGGEAAAASKTGPKFNANAPKLNVASTPSGAATAGGAKAAASKTAPKFNPSAPKIDLKSKTPPAKAAGTKFNPNAPKILNQDVDIFDIIKGHLLDEGFAETEEAAMVIMANMSEEWRQDIIEFWGPKTVTPKDSPSGTKSVQVGKKYPAQLNGRMVNVQYDKSGNKSTKPMTGMERGIQALKMRNTGHSSMSPRP